MTPLADLLQQGAGHAWLFVPSAVLLGALHGLEPGHSKTMMAAFIVAVRGTVKQAVLLGLAATLSHTAVVWGVALAGMYFGANWGGEKTEPYFQIGSAVLIIGVALWMMVRTWRDQNCARDHDHHHHDEIHLIDLDHWVVALEVFEDGVPPRFRLRFQQHAKPVLPPCGVVTTIETERPDGSRELFGMVNHGDFLESVNEIPEPHEFVVRLKVVHDDHSHDYDVEFTEHDHGHVHPEYGALDLAAPGYQDAHELAHANDIRRRFTDRNVTTGQIVMFGLTGGLIPCPASITVLLLCLQLRQFTLGVALVLCFSVGLAATMVLSGVLAALSVRHVSKRWSGFGDLARRAPYFSGALVLAVGAYTGYMGWGALN
ncbi:Efflux nickel/cobalt protein [Candidatus Terasakiella magnetica]|nr:Efflux nickel/cobalt protein [Candidatus Terasakiella magnetica]